MPKRPTLVDVGNILTSATTINTNNNAIEEAFDNTLSLDGSTPNQMGADLDMNSNDILNLKTLDVQELSVNGGSVLGYLADAEAARDAAELSATNAATSETNSATSAAEAAASALSVNASNLLQVVNNLSDLGDVPTARANLGLGGSAVLGVSADPDFVGVETTDLATRGSISTYARSGNLTLAMVDAVGTPITTLTQDYAYYSKVGDVVTVSALLRSTVVGGGVVSGSPVRVTGLPHPSAIPGYGPAIVNQIPVPAVKGVKIDAASSFLYFVDGITGAFLNFSDIQDTSIFTFNLTYKIA